MKVTCASLLKGAQEAKGVAVVIDVYRAFTCTPLLFSLGIEKSILVATPQEAFELKRKNRNLLLLGEVDGIPIDGFDLGNSPSDIIQKGAAFFDGRTVVQRTSAGVQGVLAALDTADEVLPTSYALAGSTAKYLLNKQPENVSIIAMGWSLKVTAPEDEWCARYVAHLLGAGEYDHNVALREILFHKTTQKFFDIDKPHFPAEDPAVCLQRNCYDFILKARREDDQVVIRMMTVVSEA